MITSTTFGSGIQWIHQTNDPDECEPLKIVFSFIVHRPKGNIGFVPFIIILFVASGKSTDLYWVSMRGDINYGPQSGGLSDYVVLSVSLNQWE